MVTTSRKGFAGNSVGAEVLGAFLDDGVLGLFEGEGGITAGTPLGDRAAGASVRATGTGAFLREEETAAPCVSAGMALEAGVAEAFKGVGGFFCAVVTPSGDTAGALGPAVLVAFWGKESVSSGTAVTPLEDGVEVSLGAAAAVFEVFLGEGGFAGISLGPTVWGSFLEDGVTSVSLGPAILGAFLGDEEISGGPAVTPSRDGTVGVSLGPDILGAFLGDRAASGGTTTTPLDDGDAVLEDL